MVVEECWATTLNEKSERRKAASRIAKASVVSPASAYTARRPESTHSPPAGPRPVQRGADAVHGDHQAQDQQRATDDRHLSTSAERHDAAAAWYFDGHFVVSEFC